MNVPKINPIVIGVIAVIIVLVIGGIWYWQHQKALSLTPATSGGLTTAPTSAPTLGAELYQKTQNPVGSKLPETNPFKNTNTNPLQRAVPNPF